MSKYRKVATFILPKIPDNSVSITDSIVLNVSLGEYETKELALAEKELGDLALMFDNINGMRLFLLDCVNTNCTNTDCEIKMFSYQLNSPQNVDNLDINDIVLRIQNHFLIDECKKITLPSQNCISVKLISDMKNWRKF